MSDWPNGGPMPQIISTYTQNITAMTQARNLANSPGGPSVTTWVANYVVYMPVWIPWPYPVNRVFWGNGSTASNNMNFGIFTSTGKRIYSTGSTAQSGASALQFVTPGSKFTLAPGMYFFALTNDSTTNRVYGGVMTILHQQQCGVLGQAANFALADPATMATPTQALYGLCGVTRTISSPI